MAKNNPDKIIIGRAASIYLPELTGGSIYARVDTGAKTCALWASSVKVVNGQLHVVFWGQGSEHYTGDPVIFRQFGERSVASSTGVAERRYTVRLRVVIAERRIRATFTLADRSTQAYPILLGRNVLKGKFIVDVSEGDIDAKAEKERNEMLQLYTNSSGGKK